ncbi:hypothetical protein FOA43_002592 [Brettanomyces nanus]|uniref:Uncharacterized protein n=1 Tax=Eeniella nana TaxID=13502 RepID=A0A875S5C6_EENNA|nr:uncharacterized protein FOA43_002592 [Brettanomyces nanus]QPG75242.1 hypothetical protein FOA43_002592 [Brettanomyces nanus]
MLTTLVGGARRFYSEKPGAKTEKAKTDKDGFPISESESIFNRYTGFFFGTVIAVIGYRYFNSQYKASHNGEPILSVIKKGSTLEDLKANYKSYRERVAKREELHSMMADTKVKDSNNVVTSITEVPGKVQCFSGNGQFNTIQDWTVVGPRKQKENPFR